MEKLIFPGDNAGIEYSRMGDPHHSDVYSSFSCNIVLRLHKYRRARHLPIRVRRAFRNQPRCIRKGNSICNKADITLRSSQAVARPSTDRALCCLASVVERDPVHSKGEKPNLSFQKRRNSRSGLGMCVVRANTHVDVKSQHNIPF